MQTFKEFTLIQTIECKQAAVRAVRYNVDGAYCITCGSDKTLKLWNPYKGTLLHSYMGHGSEVLDAKGTCDNSQLVSCGVDKMVLLWDVSSGNVVRRLRGHHGRINAIALNEESTVALTASVDSSVRLWDLRSRAKEPIQVLDDATDSVMSVNVCAHEVLTASLDGYTRVYDLRKGVITTNCIGESVTCACLSSDAQCVLASSINSGLRLMDKSSGELLASFKEHRTSDLKMESCFCSSDAVVVSGSEDGTAFCWDLISAKVVQRLFHAGSRVVHSVSPHPTNATLLTASLGKIWMWAVKEEQEEDEQDISSIQKVPNV